MHHALQSDVAADVLGHAVDVAETVIDRQIFKRRAAREPAAQVAVILIAQMHSNNTQIRTPQSSVSHYALPRFEAAPCIASRQGSG